MYLNNLPLPIFFQKKASGSFMAAISEFFFKNMSIKKLTIFLCIYSLIITGFLLHCFYSGNKRTEILQERSKICAASFSEAVQASLHAAYSTTTLTGEISAHGKEISQAIIFSQLPESERLKGYEDYIHCLEDQLNR